MKSRSTKDISKDWNKRGFSCGLWTDPPGQRWEDFVHRTDELVLVMEGELELEISGVTCHPKIGEELFIPAGALHSVRNIGNTTARWLYGYGKKKPPNNALQPLKAAYELCRYRAEESSAYFAG